MLVVRPVRLPAALHVLYPLIFRYLLLEQHLHKHLCIPDPDPCLNWLII